MARKRSRERPSLRLVRSPERPRVDRKSRLLVEEERREAEADRARGRREREIERDFRREEGSTSKRALRAVKRLGFTRPHAPRTYPSHHYLLEDYAALRGRGRDHREAAGALRERYGAASDDAVTAQLHRARATLRRELRRWASLPPDAPGGEPEYDDGAGGYSGPTPAGEQARYLRALLDATRGIPTRG